jgi:hypothetical protein
MLGQFRECWRGTDRGLGLVFDGVVAVDVADFVVEVDPLAPAATPPPAAIAPQVAASARKRLRLNIGCSFLGLGMGIAQPRSHSARVRKAQEADKGAGCARLIGAGSAGCRGGDRGRLARLDE